MNTNLLPIDVVFTWVDGSDPEWIARNRDMLISNGLADPSKSPRYADHEELRYSLRSVERFLPWARKIFIVTDRQKPKWLDANHPKIRIVDHREIFLNAEDLPTFNSVAIEANLHRIPGISERFIYFNDDMMLGRPFEPEDFFAPDGRPRSFIFQNSLLDLCNFCILQADWLFRPCQKAWLTMRQMRNRRASISATVRTSLLAIIKHNGRAALFQKTNHTPIAHCLTTLNATEQEFASEFRACCSHHFRSGDDLFFPLFFATNGLMRGLTVPSRFSRKDIFYFHLGRDESEGLSKLLDRTYGFISVNDGKGSLSENDLKAFRSTMDQFYPQPAPFEIPAPASRQSR